MIEKVIYDYLSTYLDIPVYMEKPKAPPTTFVVIEKTSAGRSNYINSSTLAIQSYSDTLFNTATLSDRVKELMYNSIALDAIARCDLNSEYNYTDTQMKKYRYQAVFDLTHY